MEGVIVNLLVGFTVWHISSNALDLKMKDFQYIKIYEPLVSDLIGMGDIKLGNFSRVDYKIKMANLIKISQSVEMNTIKNTQSICKVCLEKMKKKNPIMQ